ncbi:MAG: hypothetical protein J6K16_04775 [Alphaproteobacteria bacterium]|nr:hypothetical protein [Alphaproteobacteria bacterium]
MKKYTLGIITASVIASAMPVEAQAFILPPFKIDFSTIANKVLSTTNTISEKVNGVQEQSTAIQTIIQYGEGAKELWDFNNLLDKLPIKQTASAKDLKELEKQQTEAKDKEAQDVANATREANEKIAGIDENINELEQDSLENPQNAKENVKKAEELRKEKKEIKKGLKERRKAIKSATKEIAKGFKESKQAIMKELKSLKNFIKTGKDYDSTEDLKGTVETLSPKEGTEINANIIHAYRELYNIMYWNDFNTVVLRGNDIRTALQHDNEETEDVKKKSVEMEGASASRAASTIDLKKRNMQALLNYTEMILQQIKLSIAYDLASNKFNQINANTAIGTFNFDNYKFNPEEENIEVEKTEGSEYGEHIEIAKDLATPSAEAIADSMENIKQSAEQTNDEGENK